jgi:membrane-associated protease RseP (regulator of RpoE activity)
MGPSVSKVPVGQGAGSPTGRPTATVSGVEPYPGLRDYEPIQPKGGADWRGFLRRIWAPIAAFIGLGLKFGILFSKFGLLFVSVAAYSLIWGWRFAIGIVALILVHEMGHFVEARRQGLRPTLPTFIPFVGAFVTHELVNPWRQALISLAGPFLGGLGATAVWLTGEATGSRLLQALGYFGFLLNLFNLLPVGFLDGGSIARSFRYLRLGGAPTRAVVVGVLYGGLAVALAAGMYGAHVAQHRL